MAKKPKNSDDTDYTEEYSKALEEELDNVWDMLKRLVEAAGKPDHALFDQVLDEVRDWVADTT